MYGAGVGDDETLPAQLEKHLNGESPGDRGSRRFEVWNFGTGAYTLGQAAHLAHTKLNELEPDLLIVQHPNVGRRPFLATHDLEVAGDPPELQRPSVDFFLEQFRLPETIPIEWHRMALASTALYRSLTASNPYEKSDWSCKRCNEINAAKARALSLAAAARGVAVIYLLVPASKGEMKPQHIFPELSADRTVDLYQPGRASEFYEAHPPAHVLKEYAALLAATLQERGLLASSAPRP